MKAETLWNLQDAIIVIQTFASIPKLNKEPVEHLQQVQEVLRLSGIESHLYGIEVNSQHPNLYYLDCAGELWNDFGKDAIYLFEQKFNVSLDDSINIEKINPSSEMVLNTEYKPYIQEKLQQIPLVSFFTKENIIKNQPFLFQIPHDLKKYIKDVRKKLPKNYSIITPDKIQLVEKEYFHFRLKRIQNIIKEHHNSSIINILNEKLVFLEEHFLKLVTDESNHFSFMINSYQFSAKKEFQFRLKANSMDDERIILEFLNFDLILRHVTQNKPVLLLQEHQFVFLNADKQQKRTFTPIDRNNRFYSKEHQHYVVLEEFHKIKDEVNLQQQLQSKSNLPMPKGRF